MKKIFSLLFLSIGILFLGAENFKILGREYNTNFSSEYVSVKLYDDATIDFEHYTGAHLKDTYVVTRKNGLLFIELGNALPGKHTDRNIYYDETKSILILAGKNAGTNGEYVNTYLLGYSPLCTPKPLIENTSRNFLEGSYRIYKDATSYLIEKKKSYPVENLCSYDIDTPWVENVPGYGIGEGFTIENTWDDIYTTLLIMNGYISYEKPYLYEQNGRIKKIRVTGLKSGKSQILTVLDTPHPQTVDISFITEAEDLRVTIEDIYPGVKYEDTCLQYLVTWNKTVIPYENQIDFSKGK